MSELYHHGIKGQHWGVRNGPPYPLSSTQKSSEEESFGVRSGNNKNNNYHNKGNNNKNNNYHNKGNNNKNKNYHNKGNDNKSKNQNNNNNNQKRTMGDYVNLDYFYPNRIKKPNVFNTYRLKRAFKTIGKPLAIIVPSALGLAAIFLSLDNDIQYPYGGMTNLFDKVASAAKDYLGNYPSNSNRTMADLFNKEFERHAIMNGQRAIESCINANCLY